MNINNSAEIAKITPFKIPEKATLIPLYGNKVRAGFASPADDFIEEYLDLNKLLIQHQEATFFVRVVGRSMVDAGIYPNDILIVDRSLEAANKNIVIAVIDGETTVKRLITSSNGVILKAESKQHKDITIDGELHVWGVVTACIHQL